MLKLSKKIYLDKSLIGGRGVFAKQDIVKGEVLETAPYIIIKENNCTCELTNYKFSHDKGENLVCLGYGAMYNHSRKPNLKYRYSNNELPNCLDFVAIRDIRKDEELFITYGRKWWRGRDKKQS